MKPRGYWEVVLDPPTGASYGFRDVLNACRQAIQNCADLLATGNADKVQNMVMVLRSQGLVDSGADTRMVRDYTQKSVDFDAVQRILEQQQDDVGLTAGTTYDTSSAAFGAIKNDVRELRAALNEPHELTTQGRLSAEAEYSLLGSVLTAVESVDKEVGNVMDQVNEQATRINANAALYETEPARSPTAADSTAIADSDSQLADAAAQDTATETQQDEDATASPDPTATALQNTTAARNTAAASAPDRNAAAPRSPTATTPQNTTTAATPQSDTASTQALWAAVAQQYMAANESLSSDAEAEDKAAEPRYVAAAESADHARYTGSTSSDSAIQGALDALGIEDPEARENWTKGYRVLIERESGGDPNAVNNWDSNAAMGQSSRGLTQTIPGTFSSYHVAGTSSSIHDPVANVAASMNYVMHRYDVDRDGSNLQSAVQQADPNRAAKGY